MLFGFDVTLKRIRMPVIDVLELYLRRTSTDMSCLDLIGASMDLIGGLKHDVLLLFDTVSSGHGTQYI